MQTSVPETGPYYFVYQTTNLVNGKIYIGAHKTNNLDDDYLGSGKILQYAIKKYGVDNFLRTVLCFCHNIHEMYALEYDFLNDDFFKLNRDILYNLKVGGHGGIHSICLTEESKRKKILGIIKANTGRKQSKKACESNRKSRKLLWTNPEYRNKCILSHIGKKQTKEQIEKRLDTQLKRGILFSKYTDVVKKKMSEHRKDTKYISKYVDGTWMNKLIKSTLLDSYIRNGWILGRKTNKIGDSRLVDN